MKKLFAGLCAFVLAMSMFGCGDEEVKKACAKCKKTPCACKKADAPKADPKKTDK